MKIAPLRLLTQRWRAVRADGPQLTELGLGDDDLSPRARERLLGLLDDLDRLRREADRLAGQVRDLEALADTDPLACVLNRRAFIRELSRALAFSLRHGGPVSVLYVDLDNFKSVNDEHGHRAGDAAIVHAANVLKASLRETDTLGRLGGDEFAIALIRAGRAEAELKAARLRELLRGTPLSIEGRTIALDASIGVHEATPLDTPETALRAADEAMFSAKNAAAPNAPLDGSEAKRNRPLTC